MKSEYAHNIRQMRIVYTISAIAVLLAITCLVLAVLAGTQLNPPDPVPTGLEVVSSTYQTSQNPMQPGGMLLSSDRTQMMLFTDNLYVIDLSGSSSTVKWAAASAGSGPFPYQSSFLTLSPRATLQVQVLADSGQTTVIWSNQVSLPDTDNYTLQINNAGKLQVFNSASLLVWTAN